MNKNKSATKFKVGQWVVIYPKPSFNPGKAVSVDFIIGQVTRTREELPDSSNSEYWWVTQHSYLGRGDLVPHKRSNGERLWFIPDTCWDHIDILSGPPEDLSEFKAEVNHDH